MSVSNTLSLGTTNIFIDIFCILIFNEVKYEIQNSNNFFAGFWLWVPKKGWELIY